MLVELISMSTFNQNTFKVNDGKNDYICHCAYPDRDWDKLYDHLMGKFNIELLNKNVNNEYIITL